MKGRVVNDFWFEVVRRSRNRYDWVFVADCDGRPRVLARSGREYRSRKKVRRAIRRLRYEFPRADIRRGDEGFSLPRTRFELVPGVLPLVVRESRRNVLASRGHATVARRSSGPRDVETREQPALEPSPQRETRPEPEPVSQGAETSAQEKPVAAGRKRKAT